jgi:hypothetical protein
MADMIPTLRNQSAPSGPRRASETPGKSEPQALAPGCPAAGGAKSQVPAISRIRWSVPAKNMKYMQSPSYETGKLAGEPGIGRRTGPATMVTRSFAGCGTAWMASVKEFPCPHVPQQPIGDVPSNCGQP